MGVGREGGRDSAKVSEVGCRPRSSRKAPGLPCHSHLMNVECPWLPGRTRAVCKPLLKARMQRPGRAAREDDFLSFGSRRVLFRLVVLFCFLETKIFVVAFIQESCSTSIRYIFKKCKVTWVMFPLCARFFHTFYFFGLKNISKEGRDYCR